MNDNFLSEATVMVTGGMGFVGSVVVEHLNDMQIGNVVSIDYREYDLTKKRDIIDMYHRYRPDIVIHMAASVGGIGLNRSNPADMLYQNLLMNTMVQHYAWKFGVRKFVGIGSVCAYPERPYIPFLEDFLFDGYPEKTNAAYGMAKRMMLVQSWAYREQYGFNAIHVIPTNIYGPGDNFNPKTSHVIPAIIKKMVDARDKDISEVQLWGSGEATRDFLFVDDAARGIVMAMEKYDKPEPINLSTEKEVSIRDLAWEIADIASYSGGIRWDDKEPDGQPRRMVSRSRAKAELDWEPAIDLYDGLCYTVGYYEDIKSEQ